MPYKISLRYAIQVWFSDLEMLFWLPIVALQITQQLKHIYYLSISARRLQSVNGVLIWDFSCGCRWMLELESSESSNQFNFQGSLLNMPGNWRQF